MGDFTALCTRCKKSTRITGLGSLKGVCAKCGNLCAVGIYRTIVPPTKVRAFNLDAKTNKLEFADVKGVNFIRARRK